MKLSVARKSVTRNLITLVAALIAIGFVAPSAAWAQFELPPPPPAPSCQQCRMFPSLKQRHMCLSKCTTRSKSAKPRSTWCAKLGRRIPPHQWTAQMCKIEAKPECAFGAKADGSCKTAQELLQHHASPAPKPESHWTDFFFISLILLTAGGFTVSGYHVATCAANKIKALRAKAEENRLRLEMIETEDDRLMAEAYVEIEACLNGNELRGQIDEGHTFDGACPQGFSSQRPN